MRLIDADELIEELIKSESSIYPITSKLILGVKSGYRKAIVQVEHAPTIEAEPVRHGEWEHLAYNKFRCTACERASYVETVVGCPSYEYCPHCGAKMDGEKNE